MPRTYEIQVLYDGGRPSDYGFNRTAEQLRAQLLQLIDMLEAGQLDAVTVDIDADTDLQ
jgi:hypothetical protein